MIIVLKSAQLQTSQRIEIASFESFIQNQCFQLMIKVQSIKYIGAFILLLKVLLFYQIEKHLHLCLEIFFIRYEITKEKLAALTCITLPPLLLSYFFCATKSSSLLPLQNHSFIICRYYGPLPMYSKYSIFWHISTKAQKIYSVENTLGLM